MRRILRIVLVGIGATVALLCASVLLTMHSAARLPDRMRTTAASTTPAAGIPALFCAGRSVPLQKLSAIEDALRLQGWNQDEAAAAAVRRDQRDNADIRQLF